MKQLSKTLFVVILTVVTFSSCQELAIEDGTPDCIENSIKEYDETQDCNDGVNVTKYLFQGEMVYVFNPGNCGADMMSNILDSDCNSIGYLGGIAGNTEVNGEDFSNAKFISVIWEK